MPLIYLSLRTSGKFVRPAFRTRQHELGELNAILADNLSGIREIKTFSARRKRSGSDLAAY